LKIGYARVSTTDQNLDLQLDALNKAGCAEIFPEKLSGARDDRTELERCLNRLRKGDVLVVWKLDRLGRSLHHLMEIMRDLEDRGIDFQSLNENIDTTTHTGRFMFIIMGALGEFERSMIIERTRAGRQAARARGKYLGGPRLYGDDPHGEKQEATITPEQVAAERDVLKEIAKRLLDSESVGAIIKDLNHRGITTTMGSHWRSNTVRQVMSNPNIAVIIGQEQSDRLQRLFADPSRKRQGRPTKHLLTGILRCKCGGRMYVVNKGRGQTVYSCYHSNANPSNCGKTWVSAPALEAYVTEATIRWLAGPGLVVVRNRLMKLDQELSQIAKRMHDDEKELIELAKLKGEGRYTTPEWLALRDPIEARIKAARELLDKEPAVLALTNIPETRAELEAAWPTWDVERKRSVLKAAIASLFVWGNRGPLFLGPHFDQGRVYLRFVSDSEHFSKSWATEEDNAGLLDQVARDLDQ
jgi:DNA invertase Pin-like site-specific DNA recombinase